MSLDEAGAEGADFRDADHDEVEDPPRDGDRLRIRATTDRPVPVSVTHAAAVRVLAHVRRVDPDATAAGFSTALSSKDNMDGLAFGGGLAFDRGKFGLSLDYARRDLGVLGGTDFFSATISW